MLKRKHHDNNKIFIKHYSSNNFFCSAFIECWRCWMNEFIVWDEKNKGWICETHNFFINSNGVLCSKKNNGDMFLEKDCKFFRPIGKTDINDKKIYPDCSIVEFGYEVGTAKHIAYFYFDTDYLEYKVRILSSTIYEKQTHRFKGQSWSFSLDMINLKIIDTIQENKLGLI